MFNGARRKLTFVFVAGLLMAPAPARAASWCVGPVTGCDNTATGLQAALDAAAAAPGADTVRVGAGSYEGPFTYSATDALQITGAGEGTVLGAGAVTGQRVLDLTGAAAADVSNLRIELQADDALGLMLGGGHASDLTIHSNGGSATGAMGSGTITGTTIDIAANNAYALQASSGPITFTDGTLESGFAGVYVDFDTVLRRSTIESQSGAYVLGATFTISDSVIRLEGTPSYYGIDVGPSGVTAAVDATNLTIVGTGSSNSGIYATAAGARSSQTVLANSIVRGVLAPIRRGGTGTVNVTAVHSDYSEGAVVSPPSTPGTYTHSDDNLDGVDPLFVDAAGGDFRLRAASPLIDRADAGATGLQLTDRRALPRSVDGDADATAAPDIGAYEYQHSAASITSATAAPGSATIGEPVAFAATASLGPDGIPPLVYSWAFDDGTTVMGAAVTHSFATAGVHGATVTVTDADGATVAKTVSVPVTGPAPQAQAQEQPQPQPQANPYPYPAVKYPVPNVVGKPLARAKKLLVRAHCRIGRVHRVRSRKFRRGRVVKQSPRAGRKVVSGTKVTLYVSRGRR